MVRVISVSDLGQEYYDRESDGLSYDYSECSVDARKLLKEVTSTKKFKPPKTKVVDFIHPLKEQD